MIFTDNHNHKNDHNIYNEKENISISAQWIFPAL